MTHTLFSVSGGKFHRPGKPFDKSQAWRPTETACGITVTPVNYFKTDDDADKHTGGRLATYLCKHCAAKGNT